MRKSSIFSNLHNAEVLLRMMGEFRHSSYFSLGRKFSITHTSGHLIFEPLEWKATC